MESIFESTKIFKESELATVSWFSKFLAFISITLLLVFIGIGVSGIELYHLVTNFEFTSDPKIMAGKINQAFAGNTWLVMRYGCYIVFTIPFPILL